MGAHIYVNLSLYSVTLQCPKKRNFKLNLRGKRCAPGTNKLRANDQIVGETVEKTHGVVVLRREWVLWLRTTDAWTASWWNHVQAHSLTHQARLGIEWGQLSHMHLKTHAECNTPAQRRQLFWPVDKCTMEKVF